MHRHRIRRRVLLWASVGAFGIAVAGCAPKSFVQHQVAARMKKEHERVEEIRDATQADLAALQDQVAALSRQMQEELLPALRAVREDLDLVRREAVTRHLEDEAAWDRVRRDAARLNAAVLRLEKRVGDMASASPAKSE